MCIYYIKIKYEKLTCHSYAMKFVRNTRLKQTGIQMESKDAQFVRYLSSGMACIVHVVP